MVLGSGDNRYYVTDDMLLKEYDFDYRDFELACRSDLISTAMYCKDLDGDPFWVVLLSDFLEWHEVSNK